MLWRDPAQDMRSIALSAMLRCEPRPMSTSVDLPVNSAWPPVHSLVWKLAFSTPHLFLTCNFTFKESTLAVLARANAVLSALEVIGTGQLLLAEIPLDRFAC
jgi:hypothetical protein